MKIHPIFSNEYYLWWGILAILTAIKFAIFGLPILKGYETYGILFWTLSTLLWGLIFGSIVYLFYKLIKGKLNNNIYMICITLMWFLTLVFIH